MYPAELVMPMKEELTSRGFEDLQDPEDVAAAIDQPGTSLIVVNSVCGCAAANARPGAIMSLGGAKKPTFLGTVFAGFDKAAVDEARGHMAPYPPSSPSMALFKDGQLVHFIERHQIEGRPAELIAKSLQAAYEEHC